LERAAELGKRKLGGELEARERERERERESLRNDTP
jgi:hypothetical protein